MVSVSEASSIIQSHLYKPETEKVAITDALNRVLAESVQADRDFPPFNRIAMDGIAIQYDQFKSGRKSFTIEGTAQAGQPKMKLHNSENCIEVMTGAPLPDNTDTVIRYEDIEIKDGKAIVTITSLTEKQNIHSQGQDAKQGDILLSAGAMLSPAEIALIASVGISHVSVWSLPKVAIISTGDELVDIQDKPEAHQIRRSNSYALQAALKEAGCTAKLFHLPDLRETLETELAAILKDHELLILSGGVSKGKFDFVPEVLDALGVKKHFHKVTQKPGKPFWFGSVNDKTIFALPGNPVSTFMCFYKYIKPWLLKSLKQTTNENFALLANDFQFDGDVTYFLQVKVINKKGSLIAQPNPGGGSGDFANLKDVNAFLELPKDQSRFKKGEAFPVYFFRHNLDA